MNEQQLDMDMLLKMTPEDFTEMVKSQTLGINSSLSKLIALQYSQCASIKDSLVAVLRTQQIPEEDKAKHNKALNDLYTVLQLLEDRYNIIEMVMKDKESR